MLKSVDALFSNTLKLHLLCINMRINAKLSITQVYSRGHTDSVHGQILIFLTAGMPFRGKGRLVETED